jgi:hypothetical protein
MSLTSSDRMNRMGYSVQRLSATDWDESCRSTRALSRQDAIQSNQSDKGVNI